MKELVGDHNGGWLPVSQIRLDPADCGVTLGDQVTDVEWTLLSSRPGTGRDGGEVGQIGRWRIAHLYASSATP